MTTPAEKILKLAQGLVPESAEMPEPKDMLVYWYLDKNNRVIGNRRSRGRGAHPVITSPVVDVSIEGTPEEVLSDPNSKITVRTQSGSVYILGKPKYYDVLNPNTGETKRLLDLGGYSVEEEAPEISEEDIEYLPEDLPQAAAHRISNLRKLARFIEKTHLS